MKLCHMLSSTLIAATVSNAHAGEAGVMNFTFSAPHRDRLVQALVTYPAQSGGMIELVGNNAVFKGVMLKRDAMPERKKHPLVILSHGSGGNAANVTWLSKMLAEQGFITIAPNHQGSTSADSTPETTIPATWLRKQDMSALLDAIAATPALADLVDLSDVTAIGFSLGGHTVLALKGAEVSASALADNCESAQPMPGCTWLQHGNQLIKGDVNLRGIDAEKFEASYSEPRVRRIIAIDPAFSPIFKPESLAGIEVPALLLNLGAKNGAMVSVEAQSLADAIPNAAFARIEDADHFSFLAECKWYGGMLIWWEGDDPVCTETSRLPRRRLHAKIGAAIVGFLTQASN